MDDDDQNVTAESRPDRFELFFADAEPRLRAALVSKYGGDLGREAAAEALTYGWHHWHRVEPMENPAGYLYRVGDRWAGRQAIRRQRSVPTVAITDPCRLSSSTQPPEPGLAAGLGALTLRQRQAVVLVVGFGLTHAETADLLGLSRSSVQNHVERGMANLRRELGVCT